MNTIFIGTKYYRYLDEETIQIIRILKMKNKETFIVEEEGTKDRYKIDKSVLDDFTKLTPDGYVTFSIVELDAGVKDVIVSLLRMEDIKKGINIPYAACRQNIYDLFSNQIRRKELNNLGDTHMIGMSMNKDNTPEGVPYEMILACNKICSNYTVSCYIDDTLDILLSMVKDKEYNIVLRTLKENLYATNVMGNCTTLKELLIDNDFMYDFHYAFNIIELDFDLEITDTYELISEQRMLLEDKIKSEMFKTYVLKYNKDINLDEIKREYVLVNDKSNNLYIIAYDKGKYINRYYQQNIKDKRDVLAMIKHSKKN